MAGFVVLHISQEDYDAKIRNKTIDEFMERLKDYKHGRTNGVYIEIPLYRLNEIAEEMRGAEC